MKYIDIDSMKQSATQDGCEIIYSIKIDHTPYDLTYKITGDIFSVPERCDAVVASLLLHAMRNRMNIRSALPISKKLFYNFVTHIIPNIHFCNPDKTHKTILEMPVTEEAYNSTWNGTGISLGVDSLCTIHEYTDDCLFDDLKLTHLVHLKVGAHHANKGYFCKNTEDSLFAEENASVKNYCEKYNYNLVTIESNLFEICNKEFGFFFGITPKLLNLGTMLLVQHKFNKYYYASAYNLDKFSIDVNADMAYYEKWLIPYLESENIKFFSANKALQRFDKTEYLTQFPDTYDFLHVCVKSEKNCGTCIKCLRTIVALDLLGALPKYKNVFDLEAYYAKRKKYIRQVIAFRKKDPFYQEIYTYMKKNGIKTPGFFPCVWARIIFYGSIIRKKLLAR